jgi:hypothetical protein
MQTTVKVVHLHGEDQSALALQNGSEHYVFIYDHTEVSECLRAMGRYASNPDLSFSWYNAAILSQAIRSESAKQSKAKRF